MPNDNKQTVKVKTFSLPIHHDLSQIMLKNENVGTDLVADIVHTDLSRSCMCNANTIKTD